MALLPCEDGVESLSDAAGPKGSAARGSSYSNMREAQLALRCATEIRVIVGRHLTEF